MRQAPTHRRPSPGAERKTQPLPWRLRYLLLQRRRPR